MTDILATAAGTERDDATDALLAALTAIGEPAVPHLAAALADRRENVR